MAKLFEVVTDLEDSGTVRCTKCGCQFDWDVHEEINLEQNELARHLVMVCPACGATPKL